MSRAFVKEADGWLYCRYYLQTCRYADEGGQCTLPECELEQQWLADDDEADAGPDGP